MIERACLRFDGIIGWLTYCGFEAREAKTLEKKTIDLTAKKASKMVASEFESFKNLHKSSRYSVILRDLARKESSTWAELKRTVETKEGVEIGQGEITKLLSNLEDSGFVTKSDSTGVVLYPRSYGS